ncbi:MAG: glycosyltransferase family 4 protein [candidate division KSB1 bacterium]|nr:glycosyltransferase family 4 protein [candidate division KSB1 bacterium]MDZ7365024.1 glycosyltransferase family 4 protein [candidate division KSB1 bacterium]MDZ7403419.1 glycosyltransferase family 4 protein [candidate division KSB1 bacterium]
MNILFINSIQMFGGGEIWMLRTLRALQERGHRVWLCCRPETEVGQRAIAQGIPVESIKFSGDFNPVTIFQLARFMKRQRIEVVLTNMDKELRLGGMAAKIAGVPAVIPRRGIDYPLKNRWRYRFAYNVLATKTIANSQATKRALLREAPWLHPESIEVIYNGIDVQPFLHASARPWRSKWSLKADEPLLGFVGQLDERKGIRVLLAAFARIKSEVPRARLVLVGHGPLREMIESEVKRQQWEDAVLLPGFLEDVPGVMQAIDVLLLPSLWEGFGIVLIEAMAAGKPAIGTDTSSMPEIIVDGQTGYLVPPGDSEALARRAMELLKNPALREQFGHAARRRVAAKFTLERMIDQLENLFQREVDKRRRTV